MKYLHKNARVLIATFSPWKNGRRLPINGNLEPMRDFFTPKVEKTVIIDQVYPGSDFILPRIEIYEREEGSIQGTGIMVNWLKPLLLLFNHGGTHIVFKLRDFLSVIEWGLKSREAYDYYIGFEAVNALAGVLLRKLGKVKTVIYYVSDYSPQRYKSIWFNTLYLWLDRQAAFLSDFIWDVSPAMQPARVSAGLNPRKSAPVIVVPNALYPAQIKQLPEQSIEPYSLVFMGTLGEENGPGLVIEALPFILARFPSAHLHIVGGPQHEVERLTIAAKALGVAKAIVWHGFIADREKVSATIRRFAVGLAPYRAIEGSVRWYADATKIRAYLAAGLPVVTTQVPPLGREAAAAGSAILVKDNAPDIAQAVVRILSEKKRWQAMRKAAIRFARENTWEHVYSQALACMEMFL